MSRSGLRVLTVLDALERAGRPQSAAQVARGTRLPEATAWRMLQTLTEWGGVERDPEGTYRIAMRLWAVGSSAPCVRRLQRDSYRHLKSLHEETGMDVALSVYDGTDAILVSVVGKRHGQREGDRIAVSRESSALGSLLAATRDLEAAPSAPVLTARPALDGPEFLMIAKGIADPTGAIVAAVTLASAGGRRSQAAASRALDAALPRIRFSIYQDELFA